MKPHLPEEIGVKLNQSSTKPVVFFWWWEMDVFAKRFDAERWDGFLHVFFGW